MLHLWREVYLFGGAFGNGGRPGKGAGADKTCNKGFVIETITLAFPIKSIC